MKKKFYAILMTSLFLVGVISSSAFAAATLTVNAATNDNMTINEQGHGVLTLPASGGTGTGKISITVPAGEALGADYAQVTLESDEGLTAVFSNNVTNGKIVDGLSAGTAKILGVTLTSSTKGSYTLKFKMENRTDNNADFTIDVVEPQAPTFSGAASANSDIVANFYDTTNKVLYSGVTIADPEDWSVNPIDTEDEATPMIIATSTNGNLKNLTATFSPNTTDLTFTKKYLNESTVDDTEGAVAIGYLSGKAPKVTSKTTYTMTVTAEDNVGLKTTRDYKFTVSPAPSITVKTPTTITWGTAWSFTPTGSNVGTWSIASCDAAGDALPETGDKIYLSADVLQKSADITFTASNGKLAGTWKPVASNDYILDSGDWDGKDITRYIRLVATTGTGNKAAVTSADFTLKFSGIVPKINESASTITSKFTASAFKYNEGMESKDEKAVAITATGPGEITWTVTDLPEGLESADEQVGYTSTLYIFGSADETVKNQKITVTAKNAKGSGTAIQPSITIGTSDFKIYESTLTSADTEDSEALLISGDMKVGDSYTVTLRAVPGPVTWTSSNLPSGLTLTPSKTDSTTATLSGTLTAARSGTSTSDTHYTITAKNPNVNLTAVLSQDVMVYAAPTISSTYLFNKKNQIATKTAYSYELTATGFPTSNDWTVTVGGTKLLEPGTESAAEGGVPVTYSGYSVTGGTSTISIDAESLAEGKVVLIGSLDRVPSGGEAITVSVTARNIVDSATKEFSLTVKGTAPTLKKADITLSDTGETNSKDITVTAGDAPITMTAYIDKSTAKKVFGDSYTDDIDLSTSNVSGLIFSSDMEGNGHIYEDGTTNSNHFAYNKLPVTVTAVNTDISEKAASAKYTVTLTGTAPSWTASNDLTGYGTSLAAGATLGTTVAMKTVANQALSDDASYVVFKAAGSGPFTYTVKPIEKNGLAATLDESAGTVTITGTPEAAKKDVATKFSITVKNNSTGASAKSDITITAQPKPEVASTELSTSVMMGKKVKLTPKVTASSNGMKWQLVTASQGETTDINADTLKDTWGLTVDSSKGSITGTPKRATGSDYPLTVVIQASGDITSSDQVTAKISILGAKPKLTTKSVEISRDGTDVGDAVIETNMKDKDTTEADIEFSGNFSDVDAVSGLSFVKGTNTATLSGTPSAVTKKASVTVTMNNYGTVGTGKLSIKVNGAAPEITGDTSISVNAGESNTGSLTLGNTENLSNKVKWKIATKPSATGVSAKVKGDVNGATVTVKANKKASSGSVAFTVIATDSVTKKTSAEYEITAEVTNPDDTEAAPLEADDTAATPEANTEAEKSDEKVIGEGEVHMGAERTADKLTAQQRKFFEDEGYVIAAVLPEIEVTAAGQYDFEVDLDKEVETGAELVWFAFASKPTTDDEIVDFADEKGKETKVVPESHVVTVAPWLNAETKYAPVIAVKAAAKDADATTVEGVKEAAEAKTEE